MKVVFLIVFVALCASEATARQSLRELMPPITFCLFKPNGNYPNMKDNDCKTFIRCDGLPILLPCILPNFTFNEKTKTCTWRAKCNRGTATEKPTEAPVTKDPVTDAPATEKPDTEEPITEEPITEEPATDEPITDEPVTEEPVTEEPITEEPVTEEPITEEPVTVQPVTEEPVTEEPITEEPVTDKPITEEPVTKEPITEEPTTKTPKVECSPNGYEWLPHPTDCAKFFRCVNGLPHEFTCPPGTLYDESIQNCNHSNLVKCNK